MCILLGNSTKKWPFWDGSVLSDPKSKIVGDLQLGQRKCSLWITWYTHMYTYIYIHYVCIYILSPRIPNLKESPSHHNYIPEVRYLHDFNKAGLTGVTQNGPLFCEPKKKHVRQDFHLCIHLFRTVRHRKKKLEIWPSKIKICESEGVFCFQKKLLWMPRSHFLPETFCEIQKSEPLLHHRLEFFGRNSIRKFLQNFPAKFFVRWRLSRFQLSLCNGFFFGIYDARLAHRLMMQTGQICSQSSWISAKLAPGILFVGHLTLLWAGGHGKLDSKLHPMTCIF